MSSLRIRLGAAALTATAALAGAQAVQAADLPPGRTLPKGSLSPATFKRTELGAGLKKGDKIPGNATVRRQVFSSWKDADGTSVNTTAPTGQAIVAATGQIVAPGGKVLKTFYGVTGSGVLTIEGQVTPTSGAHKGIGDVGLLAEFPSSLKAPAHATYIVWTLFRKGADPNSGA